MLARRPRPLPAVNNGLPTCLFVGPQKAGTSWIHEYLKCRPDICLPQGVKETFFFDARFEQKGLAWYASHFRPAETARHIIEVAPSYFHAAAAASRILSSLGPIQIVVTLREPVARSFSLYLHLKRYGYFDLPLREAVGKYPEIVDSSRYAKHLQRWDETFGKSNVLVLWQEELAGNPRRVVEQLNRFLQLDQSAIDFDFEQRVNEAAVSRSGALAGIARRGGDLLRHYRLYEPIELAKRLGLKQFIYGKPGKRPLETLSDEDRQWLWGQLAEDQAELPHHLDRSAG